MHLMVGTMWASDRCSGFAPARPHPDNLDRWLHPVRRDKDRISFQTAPGKNNPIHQIWSLRYLAPSTVAVSMYLIPVITVAVGRYILNEPVSLKKASRIVTVLLGLYLVDVSYN